MVQEGFLLHVLPQATLEIVPSLPQRHGGQLPMHPPLEPHLAQSGAKRGAGRCDGLTVYWGLLCVPYA